jgi:hypothetical protein
LLNTSGSAILQTGDSLQPYSDFVYCADTDVVTVTYTVLNLGSFEWGDQPAAASDFVRKVADVVAHIYLKAGAAVLGGAATLSAPALAMVIADATAAFIQQYADQVGVLIDAAFNDVITPLITDIANEFGILVGNPNCNGEVLHDYVVFKPGEVTFISIAKSYVGPGSAGCGTPPHTQLQLGMSRSLDAAVGASGSGELFFYNSRTGSLATGMIDNSGTFFGHHTGGLRPGWSQVTTLGTDLLFYNHATGAYATGIVGSNGVFTAQQTGQLSTGWTHIAAAGAELLFYNADTGSIATGNDRRRRNVSRTTHYQSDSTLDTYCVGGHRAIALQLIRRRYCHRYGR